MEEFSAINAAADAAASLAAACAAPLPDDPDDPDVELEEARGGLKRSMRNEWADDNDDLSSLPLPPTLRTQTPVPVGGAAARPSARASDAHVPPAHHLAQ